MTIIYKPSEALQYALDHVYLTSVPAHGGLNVCYYMCFAMSRMNRDGVISEECHDNVKRSIGKSITRKGEEESEVYLIDFLKVTGRLDKGEKPTGDQFKKRATSHWKALIKQLKKEGM